MLFYCDCRYIAHHAMVVGHMYRKGLPPPLDRCASMVDLAPLVRALGVQQFVSQIATQRQELVRMMVRLGDLSQLTDDSIGETAESAVSGILFHLSKLAGMWADVLPASPARGGDGPPVLHRALGALLGVVATEVVKRAVALGGLDTAAPGNQHEVRHLLRSLVDGVPGVFDKVPGGSGWAGSRLASFVPGWNALVSVASDMKNA